MEFGEGICVLVTFLGTIIELYTRIYTPQTSASVVDIYYISPYSILYLFYNAHYTESLCH
jgi:hypothetical protein